MSGTAPVSVLKELNAGYLFNLKKHLILDDIKKRFASVIYKLGYERDFENTAVKISSNELVLKYFQEQKFQTLPKLPERNYLVACTSLGVFPIYNRSNLTEFNTTQVKSSECEWKILEISKELFESLSKEVDIPNRIIYMDIHASVYDKYKESEKGPEFDSKESITVIKRRYPPVTHCNLM